MVQRLLAAMVALPLVAFFVGTGVGTPAAAQTTDVVNIYSGGNITIVWAKPTSASGRLDCDATSENCAPLNLAACDETTGASQPRDIELWLTADLSTTLVLVPSPQLSVWFQTGESGCTDANKNTDAILTAHPITTLADYRFPEQTNEDLNTPLTLDTAEIFARTQGACGADSSGVDRTIVRLCFGVDVAGDGTLDGSDPVGYAQFFIDTVPPGTPEQPTVKALDGRIEVKARAASGDDDITQWFVRTKIIDTSDTSLDTNDCDSWWDDADVRKTATSPRGTTTETIEVSAPNGNRYAVCVKVRDALGNESPASAVTEATPRDECDFIECYPGELQTGHYCGAAGATSLTACVGLIGLLSLLRAARRRQRGVR